MSEANNGNMFLLPDVMEIDERALPAARRDVEITEQVYDGKTCYVLKDPATMRYYRLRPPEYTIYQMLDGKVNMEDLERALAHQFPDEEYDVQVIMSFIIMLRGANLLHVPGSTDTDYLLGRKKTMERSWFQKIRQEFLFFRIPVMDPDGLLNRMHDKLGGIIFSRGMRIFSILMMLGAFVLLFQNIDKLDDRQPLLSWINMIYLAAAMLLIKPIHEFGHGLTAKHFGNEVHEMGILFLVFNPCFYCDVSDAWMIPDKSKRMWITGAGIAVEIFIAGLSTYVWALTAPGTVINQFALNLMIVSSLNTIMFNGNPLLRYDGYYFLMDLMEIPNLKQKGTGYLWYLLQKHVLGLKNAREPIDVKGREVGLLGYAICSAIYRWFIMFAIVLMVWKFLDPYGWGVLGGVMTLGCIYTSFITPVVKFFKFITTNKHGIHIKLATAAVLVLLIGGVAYGVLAYDVEQTVDGQCVIRSAGKHVLYVTQPGFLRSDEQGAFVRDGEPVRAGQVLVELQDPILEQKVSDIELEIEQHLVAREHANQMRSGEDVAKLQAKIKGLQMQAQTAREQLARLTIKSPVDGVVQLLTSEPLKNLEGSYLPLRTALLAVYPAGEFEAVVAIDHRDQGRLAANQPARIKLWAYDAETVDTTVKEKPTQPVRKMSSAAFSTVFKGEVNTLPTANPEDSLVPAQTTYELVLPLPDDQAELRDGMVGRASVVVEQSTLGKAFYRWLLRTLRQDIRL